MKLLLNTSTLLFCFKIIASLMTFKTRALRMQYPSRNSKDKSPNLSVYPASFHIDDNYWIYEILCELFNSNYGLLSQTSY